MYGIPYNRPDQLERVVRYSCNVLRTVEFDTVVFRGFSGAIVGPIVALQLHKPWVLVRKSHDACHSNQQIEGMVGRRYVIIDDFIDRGTTIREIVGTVRGTYEHSECIGVVLHDEGWANRQDHSEKQEYTARIGGVPILNWPERFSSKLDRSGLTGSGLTREGGQVDWRGELTAMRFEIPQSDLDARDRFQEAVKPYQEAYLLKAARMKDSLVTGVDPGVGKADSSKVLMSVNNGQPVYKNRELGI